MTDENAIERERPVDRLMPVVYDELRALAASYLRGSAPTLQPTGLVHETYLRLLDQRKNYWHSPSHFFHVAAQAMRRVLVDHFRAKRALKRSGPEDSLTLLDEAAAPMLPTLPEVDLLALDTALERLEAQDSQQARVVEMRFFAGLTVEETASALSISTATVKRDWAFARTWLLAQLTPIDLKDSKRAAKGAPADGA